MAIDRRKFIGLGVASTVGAVTNTTFAANTPSNDHPRKKRSKLKLSCQEGRPPGETLNEKLDYLESLGFVGLEPSGKKLTGRVNELEQALRGRDIQISAICAGFKGWLISDKESIRQECCSSMKELIDAAGQLNSEGLIFVPAFNRQESLPHKEARELLVDTLKELGSYASSKGTRLLLEPLNRKECHFCRQVADAAAIARDVNSPGVGVMGDFWHMTWEETNDRAAFLSAENYLHHIHIASRERRKMPGEDGESDNYIQGFKGLKEIRYDGYISLECGSVGEREQTFPAAVELIKKQWRKA